MRKQYLVLWRYRIRVKEAVQLVGVLLILGLLHSYHTRYHSVKQSSAMVAQYASIH